MRCSGLPNEHHVQDTFVLLPTGTIDRGTPKPDAVGKVLSGSIAHLIRCSPAGEAAFIPCPEGAAPSCPGKQVVVGHGISGSQEEVLAIADLRFPASVDGPGF